MFKKILSLMISVSMLLAVSACGTKTETTGTNNNETNTQATATPVATPDQSEDLALYENTIDFTIELENGGVMKGVLYPDVAPISVENFVKLAEDNFYDGLIFHRVIPGFMIQGGGYDKDMTPKETESIKGEFASNGIKNQLKHTRGVLSMARTPDPDSASSQFFIMHQDAPHLDGEYAAFGLVKEGLEYVDEIAACETTTYAQYGMADVPAEPIIIKTITINK